MFLLTFFQFSYTYLKNIKISLEGNKFESFSNVPDRYEIMEQKSNFQNYKLPIFLISHFLPGYFKSHC